MKSHQIILPYPMCVSPCYQWCEVSWGPPCAQTGALWIGGVSEIISIDRTRGVCGFNRRQPRVWWCVLWFQGPKEPCSANRWRRHMSGPSRSKSSGESAFNERHSAANTFTQHARVHTEAETQAGASVKLCSFILYGTNNTNLPIDQHRK